MSLALMKRWDQPSTEQTFHPLSPSLAIRLNGLIQTMTTQGQKIGACYGLTKYPCNRRHRIQLRCSFCNTHVECGVSFLYIYREIQLSTRSCSLSSSKNFHSRKGNVWTCKWTWICSHFLSLTKKDFILGERARTILTVITNHLNKTQMLIHVKLKMQMLDGKNL